MEISDIKSQLSILAVLTHYGIKPDRNNRICCPFHPDKTPSMQVYPKTNTVYCFSSNCKCGGKAIDQIDFIMHKESCTKHEAILKGKSMITGNTPITKPKPTKMNRHQSQDESLTDLFTQQRKSLHRTKKALSYLKDRSLDPTKSEIGFNSYQSGWKQLQNCITFPLKDQNGNITSLYGRSIADRKGSNHYYLKNRKGLYPGYPSPETKTLIITEAILDAATIITHTDYPVLSLYGTNGWNEEHTSAIRSLKDLQEVILFFDGDQPGAKAIETYGSLLKVMKPNIKISKVKTPQGEDVNSLAQNHPGQESEILTHLIDNRTFLFSPDPRSDLSREAPAEAGQAPTGDQNVPSSHLNTRNSEYITWHKHGLDFTIIGGIGLYPLDKLVVMLRIKRADSERPTHQLRQRLDLYQDDVVEKLARKIAERLEIGSSKVHESLLELTGLLEHHREQQNEKRKAKKPKGRELTPKRIETAQVFLDTDKLHQRTSDAISKTGLVGEERNKMILWYVFVSRLREKPLHVMCLGASGTGKTYLQESIGKLIPEDHKKEITAMSDNAVYYFEEKELVNKLLLIEDLDGTNEQKVLYALRELMSKKKVCKTIVIKDSKGNLKTISLEVRGPICLAGTTTRERLYEDNSNRSLLIYLDNSKAQKERIMTYQRLESAGKIKVYEQEEMIEFLKDVQSVLKPIKVVNPYAEQLIIPEQVFKPLRTNSHYLQFIETVTFYHQRQREKKYDHRGKPYIETTIEDIEIANDLMKEVLLAKADELSKATRKFYELLKSYLGHESKDSFYSSEIRKRYRMSPATVKRHLRTLVRYGYVIIAGGSKSKGYEYEIQDMEDLTSKVYTALDEVLEKIKKGSIATKMKQRSGSVAQVWLKC